MRRLGIGGGLVMGLAVMGLVAGCQGGTGASPSTSPAVLRYDDAVGDAKGGVGPDIVAVTVGQPDAATVRFSIQFAVAPPLGVDVAAGATDTLMVFMGTQPDAITTLKDLFVMGVHGATLQDDVASGAHLSVPPDESRKLREHAVKVTVNGATITMALTREVLGNPARLYFVVGAGREGPGDQTSGGDTCPDKAGEYVFTPW